MLALFSAILGSLWLMSGATQDASQLGKMYSWLLLANTLGSVLLLGLVGANVYWLIRQLRKKAAGSNLTARMMSLFLVLTLAPAAIVFFFSMQFLTRSIDSWFDVRIDRAMEDALQLGQAALDERMRMLLRHTEQIGEQVRNTPASMVAIVLDELQGMSEEGDLTIFTKQGRILAYSGSQAGSIVPDLPDAGGLRRAREGKSYVVLEPDSTNRMQIRALVALENEEPLYLQGLYPVPLRLAELAETVESAFIHYKELIYLRDSLKTTFSLTLSLVLLLSLLAAIWSAFLSIRRIVAPVRHLARGTRAVAAGNYEKRLPVKRKDELGFLVESFNAMTEKIGQARDEAQRSRQEVEQQRAYLETVLANLSSGVLGFDCAMHLLTANQTADTILHVELGKHLGKPVSALIEAHPHLADLLHWIAVRVHGKTGAWREEIAFLGPQGRQELFCRGTPLFEAEAGAQGGVGVIGEVDAKRECQGAVVVIDDVTALIQAQRHAAWSEVARRLAHEIKNPLTPIQLSAERLRHKLAKSLDGTDAEVLDKSTRTIVQQVEAMKTMVNAFAEYAKPSIIQLQRLDLGALIEEVVALYPPSAGLVFELELGHGLPPVQADPVKLRQVLHNLIKNSREAVAAEGSGTMRISTRLMEENRHSHIELRLYDDGPGIAPEQADRIFEPYVTTKTRGTGLGLAIVKKIVEEHGGSIRLDPAYRSGAGFLMRLPAMLAEPDAGDPQPVETENRRT